MEGSGPIKLMPFFFARKRLTFCKRSILPFDLGEDVLNIQTCEYGGKSRFLLFCKQDCYFFRLSLIPELTVVRFSQGH